MKFHRIYVHKDPDSGVVRYVGVTLRDEFRRLSGHLDDARRGSQTHHARWLRSLPERPEVEVIEWIRPEDREEREKYWISLFRDYGHNLTNITEGGEGVLGHKHSQESRTRMSVSAIARSWSPAAIESMAAANTGRPRTLQTRAKISAANLGRKRSPEMIAKMSVARTGRELSAETRAKMSAVRKGKKRSPEAITKTAAALTGRKHSPETRAKLVAAWQRRKAREKALKENAA